MDTTPQYATEDQHLLKPVPQEETQIQIQANNFFPEESHFGCSRSPHLRAFLFNATMWGAWAFFFVSLGLRYGMNPQPKDMGTIFTVSWATLIGVFVIYALEVSFSSTSRYLWNLYVVEDIVTFINRLRDRAPEIWFYCCCYHYETRTRWVTEHYTEHVNGRAESRTRTRLETYQEKVVTHTEKELFRFARFMDASGVVCNDILKYNATRIDFTKGWTAGTPQTAQAHEQQKYNFVARNRNRDEHFEFTEGMDFYGFQEKMLAIVDLQKKSIFMNWASYFGFSIILMQSWLYRVWLDRNSVKARYHFNKTVFIEQ
jgi:hypothetical protein